MIRGVIASVLASVLFAALYLYPVLLEPMNANQILAFRMLLTFPAVTAILLLTGRRWAIQRILVIAGERPWVGFSLLVTAGVLALQMWLFAWAPLNGHALDVSLGYFLLPLLMVVVGRVLYGETTSVWKLVAAGVAGVGVAHEVWRVGGISWPTVAVAGGYAVYFVLRRNSGTAFSGGLWAEMALMLPMAAFLLGSEDGLAAIQDQSLLWAAVLGLGVLSAGALVAYTLASKLLPFNVFGLLSYLEPVLLVVVALLIGETLAPGQIWTYIPIWLALALLVTESAVEIHRRRRRVAARAQATAAGASPGPAGAPGAGDGTEPHVGAPGVSSEGHGVPSGSEQDDVFVGGGAAAHAATGSIPVVEHREPVEITSEPEPVTAGLPIVDSPNASFTAGNQPVTSEIPIVDPDRR